MSSDFAKRFEHRISVISKTGEHEAVGKGPARGGRRPRASPPASPARRVVSVVPGGSVSPSSAAGRRAGRKRPPALGRVNSQFHDHDPRLDLDWEAVSPLASPGSPSTPQHHGHNNHNHQQQQQAAMATPRAKPAARLLREMSNAPYRTYAPTPQQQLQQQQQQQPRSPPSPQHEPVLFDGLSPAPYREAPARHGRRAGAPARQASEREPEAVPARRANAQHGRRADGRAAAAPRTAGPPESAALNPWTRKRAIQTSPAVQRQTIPAERGRSRERGERKRKKGREGRSKSKGKKKSGGSKKDGRKKKGKRGKRSSKEQRRSPSRAERSRRAVDVLDDAIGVEGAAEAEAPVEGGARRPVMYRPFTLAEYKSLPPVGVYTTLGADLESEELQAKRAQVERMRTFAHSTRLQNAKRLQYVRRNGPRRHQQQAQPDSRSNESARERALAFARERVPKPKVVAPRAPSRGRSSPAEGVERMSQLERLDLRHREDQARVEALRRQLSATLAM